MIARALRGLVLAAALSLAAAGAEATTWAAYKVKCPLCGTVGQFHEICSCGSYIYHWPSKYQYVYWPDTTGRVLRTCLKCRLTLFMWDFREDSGPQCIAGREPDLRRALAGVAFTPEAQDYESIPMVQRLEVAERVYRVLGRDDEFWCRFYRVRAYHLDEAGQADAAAVARQQALALAERLLDSGKNEHRRKELLLVAGAMRHFLKRDTRALADFREALGLKYTNPAGEVSSAQGLDRYLTALLKDYIGQIEKAGSDDSGRDPAEARSAAGRWAACGGILGGLLILMGFIAWLTRRVGLGAAMREFFRGDRSGARRIEPRGVRLDVRQPEAPSAGLNAPGDAP
jgi:hypothetical protein